MSTLLSGSYHMPHNPVTYSWQTSALSWHSSNLRTFRLLPGDAVVFNNRTMCHGRSEFVTEGKGEGRWLMGTYAGIDDAFNVYNVLAREHGGGGGRCGNGSRAFRNCY